MFSTFKFSKVSAMFYIWIHQLNFVASPLQHGHTNIHPLKNFFQGKGLDLFKTLVSLCASIDFNSREHPYSKLLS
jgi:hypothetical protein